jgi:hypothetical protein
VSGCANLLLSRLLHMPGRRLYGAHRDQTLGRKIAADMRRKRFRHGFLVARFFVEVSIPLINIESLLPFGRCTTTEGGPPPGRE